MEKSGGEGGSGSGSGSEECDDAECSSDAPFCTVQTEHSSPVYTVFLPCLSSVLFLIVETGDLIRIITTTLIISYNTQGPLVLDIMMTAARPSGMLTLDPMRAMWTPLDTSDSRSTRPTPYNVSSTSNLQAYRVRVHRRCTMPSRFENSLILGYGVLDQLSPVRSVVAFCRGT